MSQRSFLGDLLTTLIERRRTASAGDDSRDMPDLCHALLSEKGEVSGLQIAQLILARYQTLDEDGKHAFFAFLTDDLDLDVRAIADLAERTLAEPDGQDYADLVAAAEPPRQEFLRRLNQAPGATALLVAMRVDLLRHMKETPRFWRCDLDFVHLLRSWFNRGFLVLQRVDWNSPASILEKIIAYEAVHAINDWDDLRRRLYPSDRRCFAFFHPAMPDEPLIFVEVALTQEIPGSIQHVLSEDRDQRAPDEVKTAVFYSISNCQAGLRGISFGSSLIKQVVSELTRDVPGLTQFVTLSPLPGFAVWMSEQEQTAEDLPEDELRVLAIRYLALAKHANGGPLDPVARFHLGNGAILHEVHPGADTTENGHRQSHGVMVNYLYDLAKSEANHQGFVGDGIVSMSKPVATSIKGLTA